jgi:hypothetical protein
VRRTLRARARALKASALGYGSCKRCGTGWNVTDGHTTMHSRNRGMFPLCESCWAHLGTPERRYPYYKQTADEWRRLTPNDWSTIPTDAALRWALRNEVS